MKNVGLSMWTETAAVPWAVISPGNLEDLMDGF